jgi:transposase
MDLTDEQWLLVQPLLPPLRASGGRGRPPLDPRALVNGVLWKLRYHKPWRTVPSRYGSHQACCLHYYAWKKSGLLESILDTLKEDLMTRGDFDFEKYIKNGIVFPALRNDKYDFYIHPEYAEDWKVSTGLIFYYQIAQDVEQRFRENQY